MGAKGTLYQITAKVVISGGPSQASPTTQVSILASNGEILSTTDEIPGLASGALPVTRPDGKLVITTFDTDQKVYLSVIDENGAVQTFAPVDGLPVLQVSGPNGTVFTIAAKSAGSTQEARLVILTADDVFSTQLLDGIPGGYPVVAPDGTFYLGLLDPEKSEFSTLVIRPDLTSFSTNKIKGSASFPVIIASDGTAYQSIPTSAARTTVVHISGSTVDYREAYGYPYTRPTAGPDGAIYYATADGYILRITGSSIAQSDSTGGEPKNVTQIDSNGNAYLLSADYGTGIARVTRFSADGSTTTFTLNGQTVESISAPPDGRVPHLSTLGPDGKLYVPLQDGSGYVVAVVGASGLERTVAVNARPVDSVVFGPSGTPYQVVVDIEEGSLTGTTAVVDLLTGVTSAVVDGLPRAPQSNAIVAPVVFGPDGTGYLITLDESGTTTRGLVFGAAGDT
ncbi:hypothetical protein C6A85_99485, partial [Mycobacterium sp. ITM-2017-0098]